MGECRSFHPRHSGGHIPPGSSPRTISLPQDISPGCQRENLKTGTNPYSINFVHVNGRSLYIVYQRMVVVEGGCPTPRERGGEIVHGNCPGRICPGEYIQGTCPDPSRETPRTCTSPVSQTTTFFLEFSTNFTENFLKTLIYVLLLLKYRTVLRDCLLSHPYSMTCETFCIWQRSAVYVNILHCIQLEICRKRQ